MEEDNKRIKQFLEAKTRAHSVEEANKLLREYGVFDNKGNLSSIYKDYLYKIK